MENIGYIKLHRQIMDSGIWNKPPEWYKLWTYILMTVNFVENGVPIGSKHLKYEWIKIGCPGITDNQIDSFIRWAKSAGMLTTQKTTRGMVLSVANYSQYQGQEKDIKPTQKPTTDRNTTETQPTLYNKNERMKEGKNEIYDFYKESLSIEINKRTVTQHLLICFYDLGYIPSKDETPETLRKWIIEICKLKSKTATDMVDIITSWHTYHKEQKKLVKNHKTSLLNNYSLKSK